jgi:hypothetical protein
MDGLRYNATTTPQATVWNLEGPVNVNQTAERWRLFSRTNPNPRAGPSGPGPTVRAIQLVLVVQV